MTSSILFLLLHYVCCALFFLVVQRPVFMLWNRRESEGEVTARLVRSVYGHGWRTDCIAAAYFTAIPTLILWFQTHSGLFNTAIALTAYAVFASLLLSLMSLADTVLYRFWKFKLDSSVLAYLRHPTGAFASVSALYLLTALLVWMVYASVAFAFVGLPLLLVSRIPVGSPVGGWWHVAAFFAFVLSVGALFAVIRGIKRRPNNTSMAFFSNNRYLNHSALNVIYNFVYSLSIKDTFRGKFQNFPEDECEKRFAELFPNEGTPQTRLFTTDRPNVLLVVWESLGANFTGCLGNRPEVTPNFDRLSREGVLFTQCDAGSFRTDRALVCILAGYLGQPTSSIIRYTRKLPNLPALPRVFNQLGYSTLALHGGNCAIMNKGDYYYACGHERLVAERDLPKGGPVGAWGIHDGFTFDWLAEELDRRSKRGERWFATFQTLSSHEPFKVPYKRLENPVDNSYAYTDECFGRFIDRMKQSEAWKDTVILVFGDHGCHGNGYKGPEFPHHIPLLMLGGAVREPRRIDTIMSQTDIAATLLGQMNVDHRDFLFSRDVLADTYQYPFALHSFTNGFRLRDSRLTTTFDLTADRATEGPDPQHERDGKIILQKLYADIAQR